ncbi:MAG: hypothetical protein BWK76_07015 [Desulfobulbaceae bacterium A2]|nr:MAG: hypothetical protein BWK76_07015 [Desulfobulbaceae bacterium A2]
MSDELIQLVDENNREIGTGLRRRMRAEVLIHRASYILVLNSAGELLLQRRTLTKDIYPGALEVAAGGVVLAGESYALSAQRELAEELGIVGVELHRRFDHFHDAADNRVWGRVYTCTWDGPLRLQPEEVSEAFFLPPADALVRCRREPSTPDGFAILERLLALPGDL